ncbi:hypothetical protein BDF20DRAFT_914476 [Mycotypha africana]|uniref:uncharacterized protein n=1 Tax=Mycotypha africana TaxID=64632 RepID=UPI0023010695|nr:uncharacterized protein BDF20DRAFT_914476 [Mycotypha africana]KAI8975578.1 hypothetical protein BDF20DRAFT_914476 [Mycotypha africana]
MRCSIVLTTAFAIFASSAFAAPPSLPSAELQQLKKNLAKAASDGKKISTYHIHVVHRQPEQQQQQKPKAQLQRRGYLEMSNIDPSILDEVAESPILNTLLDKYGEKQTTDYDKEPDIADNASKTVESEAEDHEQLRRRQLDGLPLADLLGLLSGAGLF